MTRRVLRTLLVLVTVMVTPTLARADVTAFLGVSPTGATRLARGAAGGAGLVVVAFEVEVMRLAEGDPGDGAPALSTGMANLLVQTPLEVSRVQFYGTAGAGLYRETLASRRETSVGVNLGGGAKIRVAGPLKLRLDYRLFRLQGAPAHDLYHRFYAGATLGF